jgi:hypothetical protein
MEDVIQENKPTKLKWGTVYFREYARYVGGGCGVPEDEGSEWPLGISDSIVVYDESGHVKGAVKAFSSGTKHVPLFYGEEEAAGESRNKIRKPSVLDSM